MLGAIVASGYQTRRVARIDHPEPRVIALDYGVRPTVAVLLLMVCVELRGSGACCRYGAMPRLYAYTGDLHFKLLCVRLPRHTVGEITPFGVGEAGVDRRGLDARVPKVRLHLGERLTRAE